MSASAPRSGPPPWTGLVGRAGGWLPVLCAVACAWLLVGGVGCNSPLEFNMPSGGGGAVGSGAGGGPAGPDSGVGGEIPPSPDARPDVPADMAPSDTGVDVPVQPDVRPDVPVEAAPEVGPDRPPDVTPDVRDTGVGVDANVPVVCTTDSQCHFPTLALHCLIPGGQTTGSCVECTGDGDCTTTGLRRCDTMTGSTTFHRCVECMNGSVATDCPSLSTEHPSTCNNEHHCLQGCSDDTPAELMCLKTGFDCQSSGGSDPDHQCADCLSQAECAAPLRCINFVCLQCTLNTDCATGLFCDNVAGRCVPCRDSVDCRAAGLRLCSPAMHICVSSN